MMLYEMLNPDIKWTKIHMHEIIALMDNMVYPEPKPPSKNRGGNLYQQYMRTANLAVEESKSKFRFLIQQIDRSGAPYSRQSVRLNMLEVPEWVLNCMQVYNQESKNGAFADLQLGEFLSKMHSGVSTADFIKKFNEAKSMKTRG